MKTVPEKFESRKQKAESEPANAGGLPASFEPYISRGEVARRVGVVPGTVDQWVKRGVLRHFRFGRVLRFKWSEVDADLAAWGRKPKGTCFTTENTKSGEAGKAESRTQRVEIGKGEA